MTLMETKPQNVAPDQSPAPAAANAAPVIVTKGLTVGYKLHRERKRLTACLLYTSPSPRDRS